MLARKVLVVSLLALIAAVPAVAGIPGQYTLDKSDLKERVMALMQEEMAKQHGGEVPDAMLQQFKPMIETQAAQQAEQIQLDLEVRSDGSFTVTFASGGEPTTETGTWAADGDTITFTLPPEEGANDPASRTKMAVYQDDNIVMKASEDTPFDMVLKPK